jgi:hypothetical protein
MWQLCLDYVFGQALSLGGYVVEDPMHPHPLGCFRIRRIGIIDNQDKAFRALRHSIPRERRRDIIAFASVLRGNLTVLFEGRRVKVMAIAALPDRFSRISVASRMPASLKI